MRVAVFDTHSFDRRALEAANQQFGHELVFYDTRLSEDTATLARGFEAVCAFVNDRLDARTIAALADEGVRLIALRSAGYNNVDLVAAETHEIPVVRVPEYSPYAIAEHTFALLLALVRRIPRAASRVRDANFSLDGLVGFDLHGKCFGIIGTGKIGAAVAHIAHGFGCRLMGYDPRPNPELAELGLRYVGLPELYRESAVISLHVPLLPSTHHLIEREAIAQMRDGVIILNTGRGALIDSRALIDGLKSRKIGGAGLDVYEEEEGLFFRDLSDEVLQDDVLARLLTLRNVIVTSHQGFLTREALAAIAQVTLSNIQAFERGEALVNEVRAENVVRPAPPPAASEPEATLH